MYKVRGADQNEYGPISAEMVREWIRQRRLVSTSLAQAHGTTEWKPLSSFPEFAETLAAPPTPPPMPGALPTATPPQRTSGLAISSLVLGILGFLTCGITALIGLVLGIVSLVKMKGGKVVGRGFAISGIIISLLALLAVPVALAFLVPAFQKGKFSSKPNQCENNLKELGLAARMSAMNNGDVFPLSFMSLSNELRSPKALVCDGDALKFRADDWSDVGPQNFSYEYLAAGQKLEEVAREPVLRCPIHKHVCLGDGTILRGGKEKGSERKSE